MSGWDWLDRAACKGMDPELFWPGKGRYDEVAAARVVCAGCPVTTECLALTWENPSAHRQGVFGGLGERERRLLKKHLERRAG